MFTLSVIILTKNEALHIARCLENIKPIATKIYVVDSFSTDGTQDIAKRNGAEVIEHEWPGNQAEQFNWMLDNSAIETEWILRLDADEYLTAELIAELKETLPALSPDITGLVFKRRHIFLNKWIKNGTYPVKILRLFRCGYARYEQRLMDEHLVLTSGKEHECRYDFCDHNLNNLSWFCKKHVDYAIREAAELLDLEYALSTRKDSGYLSSHARMKRSQKESYARKPLFWRSFAYFVYRYFFKLGFLEGREGFLWHFLQGWWYRTLVDAKIYEIKKSCGGDRQKIKAYLWGNYNIVL